MNISAEEITQRDLRSKSREIMDAVEHGQSFTVTRDGHQIAELIPLRRRRRFVSRQEFAAMSRNAPDVYVGLDKLVDVVSVTRPVLPHEQKRS